MVVTRFFWHLGASLLCDGGTAGLWSILCLCPRHLLTLLPRDLVAHLSGHLSLYLILNGVTFLLRFVLCDLKKDKQVWANAQIKLHKKIHNNPLILPSGLHPWGKFKENVRSENTMFIMYITWKVLYIYNSLSNSNYNGKKIIIGNFCYSKHAQL